MMEQLFVRVYYEDTDAGGVVYYANYLRFAERARTEWLRKAGIDQSIMLARDKIGFIVCHCTIDYKKPARLDDLLLVETSIEKAGRARIFLNQNFFREKTLIVAMTVVLACINEKGRAVALPETLRQLISA